MKTVKLLLHLGILLSTSTVLAQEQVTLSGYLRDSTNGEALIGANIFLEEIGTGTSSNPYGFYSLSVPPGTYQMQATYLGYDPIVRTIELNENRTLNLEFTPAGFQIQEVVVEGEAANAHVAQVQMSTEKLSMKKIKAIPQVLGEVDLIRSIQLLPGVTTVGEGASGFNVRGGNIDQNLILLDEATVYNSSHLFGLFSVFNSDAVKDFQLYKGGIPARYGGRLSSVLDVRQREGNNKQFGMTGGIGLISSRLTLEGPIQKEKSSFMLAGRSSYGHLFLNFFPDLRDNVIWFYDLNGKVNFTLNDKNRVFLSGYFGRDNFNFGDDFRSNWGNGTATLRWNHLFSKKLFSNFTAVFSDYNYSLGVPTGAQAFEWTAGILNTTLKADFTYYIDSRNELEFGLEGIYYRFRPGRAEGVGDNSIFNQIELQAEYAVEPAAYISFQQKIGSRLTLQYGLRYSGFLNVGPRTVFLYEDGIPDDATNVVDSISYGRWDLIKGYHGPEPRFAANYLFDDKNSVKLSYNRTRQNIHLISNTTAATPVDVWMPAGTYIQPAIADQIAAGYFRNFSDNMYEASVEVYYKWFQNLVDYRDGAELLLNENLETDLLTGDGRAYGAEFIVRKTSGRLTGWVSYTLARSERTTPGINNGETYPSNWDKLHDLAVVASWDISPKLTLSGNFAFMSGRPITYPDSRYEFEGIVIPNYNNRNGARIPAYHRMDVAVIWKPNKKPDKRWKSEWLFGIYNLYGRRNPYSIFFRPSEDNPLVTEAVRLSIFGAPLPYVTYNFKF